MAQKKAESVKGSGLSAAPPQRAAQRSEQRSEDAAAPLVNTTKSVNARKRSNLAFMRVTGVFDRDE